MVTINELYNIAVNKISNEMQKAIIRNNMSPQIAERMYKAIDGKDRVDKLNRIMSEYNEWLAVQKRQQQYLQHFLMQYFK